MAFVLGVVYMQESLQAPAELLREAFHQGVFAAGRGERGVGLVGSACHREPPHGAGRIRTPEPAAAKEIDAHQRTDEALQSAKEAAENASQAKTRYVAGMTNCAALSSILGYAQILLRSGELAGREREAVLTIQQSGQHMHALIDDLLDLARIEAGRLRLDQLRCRFPNFCQSWCAWCSAGPGQGPGFQLEGQGRMPAWVQADAKRLRQILINLLGNAVRFTEHGHVVLRVICRHEVVRFDVEDTGIGIAPQDQERIFQPFERGSAGIW